MLLYPRMVDGCMFLFKTEKSWDFWLLIVTVGHLFPHFNGHKFSDLRSISNAWHTEFSEANSSSELYYFFLRGSAILM